MGTALTEDQVIELARVAKRVILALDADRAGQEAMLRAARVARDRDLELAAVEMPPSADPAELLAARGPGAMRALLDGASGMIEFQVRRVLADAELDTPAGRDRALDSARRLIADVPESSALRHELVRTVADRLDLPTHLVTAEVPRSQPRERHAPEAPPARSPGAIALAPEEAFLASCLASGEAGRRQLSDISPELFSSQLMRRARDHLVQGFDDPLAGLAGSEPELGRLMAGVVARADAQGPASEPSLRMDFLQLELRRIDRELRRAAEQADHSRQDELAGARQDVRREMDAVMGQTA
jgi:DNA primase